MNCWYKYVTVIYLNYSYLCLFIYLLVEFNRIKKQKQKKLISLASYANV